MSWKIFTFAVVASSLFLVANAETSWTNNLIRLRPSSLLFSARQDPDCSREPVEEYDQGFHIGSVFIILVASLLGTAAPLIAKYVPALNPHPFVFTTGKHIGTGVLLSLALIHLLTPAYEALGNPCLPKIFSEDYAWAPLFALLAALTMHLIETAAQLYFAHKGITPAHSHGPGGHDGHGHHHELKKNKNKPLTENDLDEGSNHVCEAPGSAVVGIHADVPASLEGGQFPKSNDSERLNDSPSSKQHVTTKSVSAYILEFGLTAHSVIIGIAVGVAAYHDLVALVPALCFHQFFEGFALGARLAEVGFGKWNEIALALVYSFSAPVGIAIGIGIYKSYNENGDAANIIQGTFDAVSAGILLYVAFVQMVAIEFDHDIRANREWWKRVLLYVAVWLGAGVMAVIGTWL